MKKYNLVVPIAGAGSRMIKGGFSIPKPMLICGDRSILEWSMDCFCHAECNLIFAVRQEHIDEYGIDNWLREKFGEEIMVVALKEITTGAADTVYKTLNNLENVKLLNTSLPLIVYCPDTTFSPDYVPQDQDFENDGLILTFKSNSPNYSYIKLDENNNVVETREKKVISNMASVGVYCFKSTYEFIQRAVMYLFQEKSETHICPLYNEIIGAEGIVKQRSVDKIHVMGTPEEFAFFEGVAFPYLKGERKFALCSDHSGFALKQQVISIFNNRKIPYIDFGCYNEKDCDYNIYVKAVVDNMKKHGTFGIGICRSGQGINICANKFEGVRACLVTDQYHAEYAIRHNAGNFFSLSSHNLLGDKATLWNVLNILNMETFDGGRHQTRMMKNEN